MVKTAFTSDDEDARLRAALRRVLDHLRVGRVRDAEATLAAVEDTLPPIDSDGPDREMTALRLEVASGMAQAYLDLGSVPYALGHLQQAVRLGAPVATQALFVSLLLQVRLEHPRPTLKPILRTALQESWIDPTRLGRLVCNLLRLEPDFGSDVPSGRGASDAPPDLATAAAARRLSDPLLLTLLDRTVIVDPVLELALVAWRRALVHWAADVDPGDRPAHLEPFAVALANQAFATEYAYSVTADEAAAVERLVGRCTEALKTQSTLDTLQLAVIGAYRPLREALTGEALLARPLPDSVDALLRRQVREPLEEDRFRSEIPVLTSVEDATSQAVRDQYETSPYPRWVGAPTRCEPQDLDTWMRATFPQTAAGATPLCGRAQILIAGCGTGLEAARIAKMFKGVDILAVDLSRASLAHAQRRAHDLGLAETTFAQADILELAQLDRRFDLVISAGVLHHLGDPARGLECLKGVTRPGGRMLLALYSRAARRRLAGARAFAREGRYPLTADGLRRFRHDVLVRAPGADAEWREDLLNRDDFYSLSALRDLLFHVHDREFEVLDLGQMLETLGLKFGGFTVAPEVMRLFERRFGNSADALSLDQWSAFETENPDTFWHMYHFLVERP